MSARCLNLLLFGVGAVPVTGQMMQLAQNDASEGIYSSLEYVSGRSRSTPWNVRLVLEFGVGVFTIVISVTRTPLLRLRS